MLEQSKEVNWIIALMFYSILFHLRYFQWTSQQPPATSVSMQCQENVFLNLKHLQKKEDHLFQVDSRRFTQTYSILLFTLESFSTRRVPSSPSSSSTSFFPLPPSNSSFKGGLSHSHSFGSQLTSQSVGASNIGTPGLICQQYQVFATVLEKITFSKTKINFH